MKTNNQDIFQITEVDRTVKRSSTKETLDIQNCSLDSPSQERGHRIGSSVDELAVDTTVEQ